MATPTIDLAIRGGRLVLPTAVVDADLLVHKGHIHGWVPTWDGTATSTFDATGAHVFPGLVDSHVHLMDPGDATRETFIEGTAAAAASGVTTIIEHTHGWPVHEMARFTEKLHHLRDRSYVDFGLAAHVWPDRLDQIAGLWRAGIAFFKIFTCTTHGVPGLDTAELLETFNVLADLDAPCLVHCEDETMTRKAEDLLRAANRTDPGLLNEWRTREAELVAVSVVAACAFLSKARVYRVAHASNPDVLDVIRAARESGTRLSAETCPQYLLLRQDEIDQAGPLRKFTPPARIRTDADEAEMWACLERGMVDHIASDHAPSTHAQKLAGDIWEAPFGLPGLDTTSSIMFDAVARGRVRPEVVARLYADSPALFFGLTGKGRIQPGYDADLVVVDLEGERTLADAAVRSHAGWTPYAGRSVRGALLATFLRGRMITDHGSLSEERHGAFLAGAGV